MQRFRRRANEKNKYGYDNPDYWNKIADKLFANFGIKRSVDIAKVVYGDSGYPCNELYFENGMNLHIDYQEENNESTLREYGLLK